ncbi:Vacuolar protein 8, partial [Serendipita sp. 401]
NDTDVQRGASAALGNLAVNVENKVLIVKLGGLEPLIRRMQSPNIDVQCNAVGCLTNLASHDENKTEIARSGALIPLVQLAHSEDIRVQRNAVGSLLNMTHTNENRQQLVNAGATPVLVNLLTSPDTDIQYYCTTALSNIAVDSSNRSEFLMTEPELVQRLVGLMDNPSLKIQRQAASALRNLASDEKYQIDIVEAGGLIPLLRLINSGDSELILPAVACIRNLSINSQNESPLIGEGFLDVLSSILSMEENEEIQGHGVSTLRNLAASSQEKQVQVVQSGAIQKMKDLIMHVSPDIQSEMTACIAILARSEELKPRLLEMGICEVLIPLTRSSSTKIQVNSGGAIANLATK